MKLDHRRPEEIAQRRCFKPMPNIIIQNLANLFTVYLSALQDDTSVDIASKVEQTMKIMLISKLIVDDGKSTKPNVLHYMSEAKVWQEGEILFTLTNERVEANMKKFKKEGDQIGEERPKEEEYRNYLLQEICKDLEAIKLTPEEINFVLENITGVTPELAAEISAKATKPKIQRSQSPTGKHE